MDGIFSNVHNIFKNGQKSDSFAAHYGQHFKSTSSNIDLSKGVMFKVVK